MLGAAYDSQYDPLPMSRFAFLLVLFAACDPTTETATVAALRQPCVGFTRTLCLVMAQDQQPPHVEFRGIEGFSHHWGIQSEITFYREQVDHPDADAPNEKLVLLDIVEESATITAPFELEFQPTGPGWFSGSGTTFDMVGTTVVCEAGVCDQLVAADLGQSPFQVTMELTDDPQTLRATAVSL